MINITPEYVAKVVKARFNVELSHKESVEALARIDQHFFGTAIDIDQEIGDQLVCGACEDAYADSEECPGLCKKHAHDEGFSSVDEDGDSINMDD